MGASKESGPSQVVVTLAALAAGLVAQKAVSSAWRFVRGSEPGDDDAPLAEILIFAAVSAASVAAAKSWATHRAVRGRASTA